MIRLEGATLPEETRGQILPYLFGDLFLDVPGLPLQVGHAVELADHCGVDEFVGVLTISGPKISEILPLISLPVVVQIDQEWMLVTARLADPFRLVIAQRGYGGTTPAEHAKGATVYFVEGRPLYAFAEAPPGCRYPSNALVQLRINDVAQTPPCIVRLQDTRIVAGHRLVTAEFDLTRSFGGVAPSSFPSVVVIAGGSDDDAPLPPRRLIPPISGGAGVSGLTGSASGSGVRFYGAGSSPFRGYSKPAPPPPPPPAPAKVTKAPTSSATPSSGATPAPVRILTLPLGRVSADLRGLLDTAAGRYTGSPLAPIRLIADFARCVLETTYRESLATLHAASWATTRARHADLNLACRVVWRGEDFRSFRDRVGYCGMADLWLDDDGRWRYTYQDRTTLPAATITGRELVGEMALGFLPPSATVLPVTWGEGLQAGAFTLRSESMIRRYDEIASRSLELPYLATEAAARRVARHWLGKWDRQRGTGTVGFTPSLSGLTRTDRVMVDTPILERYGRKRVPWEIRGTTDRGDQRTASLIEGDPLGLEVVLYGSLVKAETFGVPLAGTLQTGLAVPLYGSLETTDLADYYGDRYFGSRYFGPSYFGAAKAGDYFGERYFGDRYFGPSYFGG